MTSHVVLNQQFIFCTFLRITSELDEIEQSIKRPTGLFFHALSDEAIKIFGCQCPLINKLDPPTYQEITNVTRQMKLSGSPCPLDQISIICFKRRPYLRSYLTEIIHVAWSRGVVPSEWKKACTILIHKKGETNDPANFRPITLESIPLKVFT
jgi:hypothetical protein